MDSISPIRSGTSVTRLIRQGQQLLSRRAPSWPTLVTIALFVLTLNGRHYSLPPAMAVPSVPVAGLPDRVATPSPKPAIDHAWPVDLIVIAPDYLMKATLLHTDIPKRLRRGILSYPVIGGDSIIGIANHFGISPETILWANERTELNPDFLRIGQELVIPPATGVLHEVKPGDTINALAKLYKADGAAIIALEANGLSAPYALAPGQRILVPGGEKPYTPKVVYGYSGPIPTNATRGSGTLGWPISGVLTQQFWTGHRAIDIGARIGSSVTAADNGYVVLVANDDFGYGKHVMVNHGNGFETLYAHLSVILVSPGQSVGRGQPIGLSGSTGRSTGPHLHFEVRYLGTQRNPFTYLP